MFEEILVVRKGAIKQMYMLLLLWLLKAYFGT